MIRFAQFFARVAQLFAGEAKQKQAPVSNPLPAAPERESFYTQVEVLWALEDACKAAGSALAFGAQHGISPQYVSDVRCGTRPPGPSICAALGLESVLLYRPVASGVPDAVATCIAGTAKTANPSA